MNKLPLVRRGFDLGIVECSYQTSTIVEPIKFKHWDSGAAILLKAIGLDSLAAETNSILNSKELYKFTVQTGSCEEHLDPIFSKQSFAKQFEFLGCSSNPGEPQEIETLYFDAIEHGQTAAEDLWMKISKLSFFDGDHSIRFRFSFGEDHIEDVASDKIRQLHAAQLNDAIFPESKIITQNRELIRHLEQTLESTEISFVERIVYFNAPGGGAYLHHDHERGHAGVVYAQASGTTFWLALPKSQLVKEVEAFIIECAEKANWPRTISEAMVKELNEIVSNGTLSAELDSFTNSTLIHLINETKEFIQTLTNHGYSYFLEPGDMILLPQTLKDECCWHSVFGLGDEAGQALSFAIRAD